LLVLMPCDRDWARAFRLYREGHTHAEIARELGVSERTIDRLFERARVAYAETRSQESPPPSVIAINSFSRMIL
jgi:orotate phosphoribosyltransferase-like protein